MPRIAESKLVLPALYFIYRHPGIYTKDLIVLITELLAPEGEDLAVLAKRHDSKFSQKIRNLVSHDTLARGGLATQDKAGRFYRHYITKAGKIQLMENKEALDYFFSNNFDTEDIKSALDELDTKKIIVYSENLVINEGAVKQRYGKLYERSSKLRNYALNYYKQKDELYCNCCKFDFYKFYGEIGKDYIEMHHIKPVYAYSEEDFEAFAHEAVKNIVPVCANCHRVIHRKRKCPLTVGDMKEYIKGSHIYT